MFFIASILLAFLLWSFLSYCMHRLAHVHHKKNVLWKIHKHHHKKSYTGERKLPSWQNFFFWFGDWHKTLDVWVIYTIPAILTCFLIGDGAYFILFFHYIYEIFLADELLEHNPKIKGKITKIFAVGDYHMNHHKSFLGNYAFLFTFWDSLFQSSLKNHQQ